MRARTWQDGLAAQCRLNQGPLPKAKSGLVALIELASLHDGGGVMQAGEIASRQGIPERYLEQMLASLRRDGILRSIRGPERGYQLARQPADLLAQEVVHHPRLIRMAD